MPYQTEKGDQHYILKSHEGEPIRNRRYIARTGSQTIEGFTDSAGKTQLLEGVIGQNSTFTLIDQKFDEHFILRDPRGVPIANMRYRIKSTDGVELEGITDESGRTLLYTSDKIESLTLVYISDDDYPASEGGD